MAQGLDEVEDATRVARLASVQGTLPNALAPSVKPPAGTRQVGVGTVLNDRFVLETELGRGGMGVVYKALDRRRQETSFRDPYVAIKILNPELSGNESLTIALQRETMRAQQLRHPNIIAVYDFDRDGDVAFMTMEYLEGKNLRDIFLGRDEPYSFDEAWPWIKRMGEALAFAHEHDVVHSDFKPGNVFITRDNEVKVMDFGLACKVARNQRDEQTVLNTRTMGAFTPEYATVEMALGKSPHPSDDIYGFACTIYGLLTGRHPYARMTILEAKEAGLKPERPPDLTRRQWAALAQAMAFSRKDRIGSMKDLLDELQPRAESNLLGHAAGIVLLLGLAGGAAFWWWTQREPAEPTVVVESESLPAPVPAVESDAVPAPETPPAPPPQPEPSGPAIAPELVERLGSVRGFSRDGVLAVGMARSSFRLGETLRLRFALARPAHVYVVYVNSLNERAQIYPNPYAPDRLHEADRLHVIPPEKNAEFDFPIGKPIGRDRLIVIASTTPLDDASEFVAGPDGKLRDRPEVSVVETLLEVIP